MRLASVNGPRYADRTPDDTSNQRQEEKSPQTLGQQRRSTLIQEFVAPWTSLCGFFYVIDCGPCRSGWKPAWSGLAFFVYDQTPMAMRIQIPREAVMMCNRPNIKKPLEISQRSSQTYLHAHCSGYPSGSAHVRLPPDYTTSS